MAKNSAVQISRQWKPWKAVVMDLENFKETPDLQMLQQEIND